MKLKALYIGNQLDTKKKLEEVFEMVVCVTDVSKEKCFKGIDVVFLETEGNLSKQTWQIQQIKIYLINNKAIFILIGNEKFVKHYLKQGVDDIFFSDSSIDSIVKRVKFIQKHPLRRLNIKNSPRVLYKIPLWKRLFDLVFASVLLILLSPLFLVVAILIRLESKGRVFYCSKRVGAGYKVFNFYKFRSMYVDADKRLADLMQKNKYHNNGEHINVINPEAEGSGVKLIGDEGFVDELEYKRRRKKKKDNAVFKIPNDPRITRVGRFIRYTSIDELPQLINVLKGDMSIVGNRPLPLYEAENLTSDKWAERFLAPAGLTGLWQVTQRVKTGALSPEDRKQLDIEYARKYSFMGDLKIILKTVPAMLLHESV